MGDLDRLKEPMRARALALLADVKKGGLPLRVFEVWRSRERQETLVRKGASRTLNSPHMHGLAFDMVLEPAHIYFQKDGPVAHSGGGAPWDTGIEDGVIVRPRVFGVWAAFGQLAKHHGLVWGGAWRKNDPRRNKNAPHMGWDPYHVELPKWRSFT